MNERKHRSAGYGRRLVWPWLVGGVLAGYVWGFGARADRVREAGYADGVDAAWASCAQWAGEARR